MRIRRKKFWIITGVLVHAHARKVKPGYGMRWISGTAIVVSRN
jgi:hypothetical protein